MVFFSKNEGRTSVHDLAAQVTGRVEEGPAPRPRLDNALGSYRGQVHYQRCPRKVAEGRVQPFLDYLAGKEVEKKILITFSHYLFEKLENDESRIKEQW